MGTQEGAALPGRGFPNRITPDMSKKEQTAQSAEYTARVNRVIDHINRNLAGDLSLRTLARVACFSPFHFHRIFHAFMGETPNQFIQRIRLEKAAVRLLEQPAPTVTDIALDCGFSGPAAFGRAFRETFGMSASSWRAGGYKRHRNLRKLKSKSGLTPRNPGKDIRVSSVYIDPVSRSLTWRIQMTGFKPARVEVRDLPDMTVAYVRHIGPYQGDSALFDRLFKKLFAWAGARGLLCLPGSKVMAVYHDNPDLTDPDKLRTDVAVTVPDDTAVDGEVGKTKIPGGKYAAARFELKNDEYQRAWDAVYGGWLPTSGFQPDDRPCFEIYLNDPREHPEGRCIVEICIPVKPA